MSLKVLACYAALVVLYFCRQADGYICELIVVCHFGHVASSHCVKWQSPELNRYHSTAARGWGLGSAGNCHTVRDACFWTD